MEYGGGGGGQMDICGRAVEGMWREGEGCVDIRLGVCEHRGRGVWEGWGVCVWIYGEELVDLRGGGV